MELLFCKTPAIIKSYVEDFNFSGLTIIEFCNSHQLALSTFNKWFNDSLFFVKKFKFLVIASASKATPESSSHDYVTLNFKGVITLSFSNIKTATLIVDLIKGLTA